MSEGFGELKWACPLCSRKGPWVPAGKKWNHIFKIFLRISLSFISEMIIIMSVFLFQKVKEKEQKENIR